jgi:hypothetical protein
MPATTLFAQMPPTPEPIIAQVERDLARDSTAVAAADLATFADRAVRGLWDSRVRGFIAILALREVRELLARQDRVISVVPPSLAPDDPPPPTPSEPPRRDVLPIPEDGMPLDPRDELPLE